MAKSLKDQNRWSIGLIIATNGILLSTLVRHDALRTPELTATVTDVGKLLPVGIALVVASVLNNILTSRTKERLVYWRWREALPSHRAFSEYAKEDARVDLDALGLLLGGRLPSAAADQNRAWFKLYKELESKPAVEQAHRQVLLLRDYTGLAALFFVVLGTVGVVLIRSWPTAGAYVLALALQYVVARIAAANCGVRMVCTVLAEASVAVGVIHKVTV